MHVSRFAYRHLHSHQLSDYILPESRDTREEMSRIIDFRKTLIMPDTIARPRKRLIFLHSDLFNLHFNPFQITKFLVLLNLEIYKLMLVK